MTTGSQTQAPAAEERVRLVRRVTFLGNAVNVTLEREMK